MIGRIFFILTPAYLPAISSHSFYFCPSGAAQYKPYSSFRSKTWQRPKSRPPLATPRSALPPPPRKDAGFLLGRALSARQRQPPAAPGIPRLARHVTAPAGNWPRAAVLAAPLQLRRLRPGLLWATAPEGVQQGESGRPANCGRTYPRDAPVSEQGPARERGLGGLGAASRVDRPRRRRSVLAEAEHLALAGQRECPQPACGPALAHPAGTWRLRRAEQLCPAFFSSVMPEMRRWTSAVGFSSEVLRVYN